MSVDFIMTYFNSFNVALYFFIGFVIWVIFLQRKWDRVCKTHIMLLVQKVKGDGDFVPVPINGSTVEWETKKKNTDGTEEWSTKIWFINELSTISVPYPGVAFIPKWLQKTIQLVVVDERDYEPITNRSVNREMVTTPELIGAVFKEQLTKAVTGATKQFTDAVAKMGNILPPMHFYIGVGILAVIGIMILMKVMNLESLDIATMVEQGIERALAN